MSIPVSRRLRSILSETDEIFASCGPTTLDEETAALLRLVQARLRNITRGASGARPDSLTIDSDWRAPPPPFVRVIFECADWNAPREMQINRFRFLELGPEGSVCHFTPNDVLPGYGPDGQASYVCTHRVMVDGVEDRILERVLVAADSSEMTPRKAEGGNATATSKPLSKLFYCNRWMKPRRIRCTSEDLKNIGGPHKPLHFDGNTLVQGPGPTSATTYHCNSIEELDGEDCYTLYRADEEELMARESEIRGKATAARREAACAQVKAAGLAPSVEALQPLWNEARRVLNAQGITKLEATWAKRAGRFVDTVVDVMVRRQVTMQEAQSAVTLENTKKVRERLHVLKRDPQYRLDGLRITARAAAYTALNGVSN